MVAVSYFESSKGSAASNVSLYVCSPKKCSSSTSSVDSSFGLCNDSSEHSLDVVKVSTGLFSEFQLVELWKFNIWYLLMIINSLLFHRTKTTPSCQCAKCYVCELIVLTTLVVICIQTFLFVITTSQTPKSPHAKPFENTYIATSFVFFQMNSNNTTLVKWFNPSKEVNKYIKLIVRNATLSSINREIKWKLIEKSLRHLNLDWKDDMSIKNFENFP